MNVKSDKWLIEQQKKNKIIEPFITSKVSDGIISFGLSSYGYDARIANEFKVFTNAHCTIIDPKNFDHKAFIDIVIDTNLSDHILIPPNGFALARTVESFNIPRNVIVLCLGKSTYARCGINVNITPIEPEFKGYITIEISNTTPLPVKIYVNEGICQFIFISAAEGDECINSYSDSGGKYMHQKGITLPRVKSKNKA
jgi:dCTP deaminase